MGRGGVARRRRHYRRWSLLAPILFLLDYLRRDENDFVSGYQLGLPEDQRKYWWIARELEIGIFDLRESLLDKEFYFSGS